MKHEKLWSRRVLVAVLCVGLVVTLGLVFVFALDLVLLTLAGVLFAIGLIRATRFVSHWTRLPYRYAYAIVLVAVLCLTGGLIYLIGNSVAQHGQRLVEQLASSSDAAVARIRKHPWGHWALQQFPETQANEESAEGEDSTDRQPDNSTESETGAADDSSKPDPAAAAPTALVRQAMGGQGVLPMVGTVFSVTGSTLGAILLVGFLAVYFALDPDLYVHGMAKLLPIDRRTRFLQIMRQIAQTLWWWIIGRMIGMAIIGGLSTLGLWIIGVPMALPLGVLAGLLNFIPNVGPTLALVPPLLFGLQEGTTTAIYVFCLYMALQFVETYLISPLIEQNQVSLPPGVTIPAQAFFGLTSGLFGLLMATPVAAVVMVLVREYYVKDWLGDRDGDDPHALADARKMPATEKQK
jgi:predicted PurR-regulated permease PerM